MSSDLPPVVERAMAAGDPYMTADTLYEEDINPRIPRLVYLKDPSLQAAAEEAAIASLTEGQLMVYVIFCFTAEVNNGGIEQFLWNHSGNRFGDLIRALRTVNANQIHDALLATADEIFGGSVPKDVEARRAKMVAFFNTHPFNDDDDAVRLASLHDSPAAGHAADVYDAQEDELYRLLQHYIASHPTQFGSEIPASSGWCPSCKAHVADFGHLDAEVTRSVLGLAADDRRGAVKLLAAETGCVGSDARIWIQHTLEECRNPPEKVACPYCAEDLRTPLAKQCLACGAAWHDPENIRLPRSQRPSDSGS